MLKLKKIPERDGLYHMITGMPASPADYAVPKYLLPQTYGRAEQEEAAARLIVICQEAGCWCGVSIGRIHSMMNEEYRSFRRYKEADEQYHLALSHYERQRILYGALCILTLGLYMLLGRKPEPPTKLPELVIPFSGIFIFGFQHVQTGLIELRERGMIRVEEDSEDDSDVIFPTPKLLGPLAGYQRVNN